jgi:hypothetical protein
MKEPSSGLHGRVTAAGEAARQHLTPPKETLVRSILITAAAACAVAIPATALASHGADDGASATTTSSTATTVATTPSTTATTSRRITATQRTRAIAAARKVVPASARVVKVEAERHSGGRRGYEVKLRTSTTKYEVDLSSAFRVIEVDRDRIGGDDDDHGGSGRDHPEDD